MEICMGLVEGHDFYLHVFPFQKGMGRAVTVLDEDGVPHVMINSRYPDEMQRESYEHEMDHLLHGDFYSDEPIFVIETRREREMEQARLAKGGVRYAKKKSPMMRMYEMYVGGTDK